MGMNDWFIQERVHRAGELHSFSPTRKGFASGVQGGMEHAVITRELMARAKLHHKDLHPVQIEFTDAFGSIPHKNIESNMK
jgi:hypothetical protein